MVLRGSWGGEIKYSSDNVMNPSGKREGYSPGFPEEGGCGGKRMCSTSSWKGKDGEDSALALQGAGTWMLGEVGNGISSTKLPKGPGKRLGGNSEKEFPKENSYSKAGMHLCQQNDANSTVQRAELEGSPGVPGSPHSHGQGAGAELSHTASPQHSRPGFNSRIWGGCGKLRVSVHPPHHSSPSSGIMVYRNSRLRGAGKAPLDLF